MGYLGVEHKVADHIELTDQGGGVFTKVMKYFHNLLRLHHFPESVVEGVHGLDVNQEAFIGVVYLDQLHSSCLG